MKKSVVNTELSLDFVKMLPPCKLAGDSLEQKTAWLKPFLVLRQTCITHRQHDSTAQLAAWPRNPGNEQQVRGLDPAVITRRSLEQTPDRSFDLESDLGAAFYPSMLQSFASKKSVPWLSLTTGPKCNFTENYS